MNTTLLRDKGYREYVQQEEGKILYQKRVIDNKGVKYFINCYRYELSISDEILINYEWDIQLDVKEGTLNIKLFLSKKTIEEIEEFFESIWKFHGKPYYEKFRISGK